MSVFSDDFKGGLGKWTQTGIPSTTVADAIEIGKTAARVTNGGATQTWIETTFAGQLVAVAQFTFMTKTLPVTGDAHICWFYAGVSWDYGPHIGIRNDAGIYKWFIAGRNLSADWFTALSETPTIAIDTPYTIMVKRDIQTGEASLTINGTQVASLIFSGNAVSRLALTAVMIGTGLSDNYFGDVTVDVIAPPLTASIFPSVANLVPNQLQTFTATGSGGIPPYTITWIDDANGSVLGTGATYDFVNSATGTFSIHAHIVDNAGMPADTLSATITVAQAPPIDINGITPWAGDLASGPYEITFPATQTVGGTVYNFTRWEDGSINPTRTINLSVDTALTATYETLPVDITINVIGATPAGTQTVTVGQTYTFIAQVPTGYYLDYWDLSGESKGSNNPLNLQITADMDGKVLEAKFAINPPPKINITLAIVGNGAIDIGTGTHEFTVGDTPTITAIPQSGIIFNGWKLDGADYSKDNPLTFTVIESMAGKTLTADFTTPTQQNYLLYALPFAVIGGYFLLKRDKSKKRK